MLKQLAIDQKALKQARKTGPYKVTWENGWYVTDAIPLNIRNSWSAARQVQENKLKITAALNLYHEKRGSPYRHNVAEHDKWMYGKLLVLVNNEINALENAAKV